MKPNQVCTLVVEAALKVHTALGAGVFESAYHACLTYELTRAGLSFEHEVHLPIVYNHVELSTAFRVDCIVEKCLIVELKCVERVLPVHRAQVLTYLRLTGLPLGLLLNFNVAHLRHGIYRLINAPQASL